MAKTIKGTLSVWKDKKGFGFIKPEDGSDDVFIHITSLHAMSRRPYVGDIIFFQIQEEQDGRSKAVKATIEGVDIVADDEGGGALLKGALIIILLMVLALAALFGYDILFNESQIINSQPILQSILQSVQNFSA